MELCKDIFMQYLLKSNYLIIHNRKQFFTKYKYDNGKLYYHKLCLNYRSTDQSYSPKSIDFSELIYWSYLKLIYWMHLCSHNFPNILPQNIKFTFVWKKTVFYNHWLLFRYCLEKDKIHFRIFSLINNFYLDTWFQKTCSLYAFNTLLSMLMFP